MDTEIKKLEDKISKVIIRLNLRGGPEIIARSLANTPWDLRLKNLKTEKENLILAKKND